MEGLRFYHNCNHNIDPLDPPHEGGLTGQKYILRREPTVSVVFAALSRDASNGTGLMTLSGGIRLEP
ncbi:MAG TPA: hypothetical protein VGI33_05285 [Paenibacillus sp.]|jgi:hypothetical protein